MMKKKRSKPIESGRRPHSACFLLLVVFCMASLSRAQNLDWVKTISSTNDERAYDITRDNAGNIWVIGTFTSTADFDPGPGTFMLSNNSNHGIFLLKLDSAGNFLLAQALNATVKIYSPIIKCDPSGNIVICGVFTGTIDFDPSPGVTYNLTNTGYDDFFFAKYNTMGNLIWAKKIGGKLDDKWVDIVLDNTGNIYATGGFKDTVDFDPGPGIQKMVSAGGRDIFLAKLTPFGNLAWAKRMGSSNSEIGIDICLDLNNNLLIAGSFSGTVDFDPDQAQSFFLTASGLGTGNMFSAKYNSSGDFIWAIATGGTISSWASTIATDPVGNIIVVGPFAGTTDFDPGPNTFNLTKLGTGLGGFVLKLDQSGNFLWVDGILGNQNSICSSAAIDGVGNIHIAGVFQDTADFDPGPGVFQQITSSIGACYFLKLDASGSYQWMFTISGKVAFFNPNSMFYDLLSNSLFIAGENVDTVTYSAPFNYTLIAAGASDATFNKISFGPVGLNEKINTGSNISIFPNPSDGRISLHLPNPAPIVEVQILNAVGQVLSKKQFSINTSLELEINGAPGFYFLKVVNGDEVRILKVVKR